jgi:hypothetical protein
MKAITKGRMPAIYLSGWLVAIVKNGPKGKALSARHTAPRFNALWSNALSAMHYGRMHYGAKLESIKCKTLWSNALSAKHYGAMHYSQMH